VLSDPGSIDVSCLLVRRASRDGWQSSDFHRLCDNKGATVVIVRSTTGHVFGGYASESWHSLGAYSSDPQAFLFSLSCHQGACGCVEDQYVWCRGTASPR
jgi:hypothetical protein